MKLNNKGLAAVPFILALLIFTVFGYFAGKGTAHYALTHPATTAAK